MNLFLIGKNLENYSPNFEIDLFVKNFEFPKKKVK